MDTFGETFTPKKLAAFKCELAKHEDDKRGDGVFKYGGRTWLVAYARFLAPFVAGVFATGRTEYNSKEVV